MTTAIEAAWPAVREAAERETGAAPVYEDLERVLDEQCELVRRAAVRGA